jgi:glyoxylase-like metal-dependent hydrolase (beta-lactamase superfamily II)
MWFEQVIRPETGCATYLVGATDTGECAVFDPLWDIEPYQKMARKWGSQIKYVIDSHSHADHVSGARKLAEAAGAQLVLPDLAEADFEARRVKGGDRITYGEVSLEVVHVPGHRPEQINLLVRDHSRGEEPWSMLTADFLLVGDLARPDLAQAGEEGAAVLFDETLPRLDALPDHLEIFPGHVAGST